MQGYNRETLQVRTDEPFRVRGDSSRISPRRHQTPVN